MIDEISIDRMQDAYEDFVNLNLWLKPMVLKLKHVNSLLTPATEVQFGFSVQTMQSIC